MKNNWQTKKLGDVCNFISRGISPDYTENSGVLVLNQKCIRDHKINYEFSRRHDDTKKKVNRDKMLKTGDGLVNSTGTGTLGRVAQVKKVDFKTTVDSHITILRPITDRFFLDFFGYVLIQIEDEIAESGEGASGQTELPRAKVACLPVSYPESISEQRRIVKILDEVFEDIERAKKNIEKNLKNSQALVNLFQNKVFLSNCYKWENVSLSSCFKLKSGENLTTKQMDSQGRYPVYGGNGIAGRYNKTNISNGATIVGRVGALCGNTRVIEGDAWITDNAFRITEMQYDFDPYFLSYLLNHENLRKFARQTAQPVISNSSLSNVILKFPKSKIEQLEIASVLKGMDYEVYRLISLYTYKQVRYEELKKSVLAKAFAGEL